MRVVSLVPSVTETLLDWEVTPIAVTRFCEQPAFPTVGGTKDPDVAAIAAMRPDLVVVNVEENRREDADALLALGIPLHVVGQIDEIADVERELIQLRAGLGLPQQPPASLPPRAATCTRVAFVPIWRRPWMAIGTATYGAAVLAWLGVATSHAPTGEPFPETTLEDAAALRPDLVLAPSEPYPFAERHRAELAAVAPVVFVDGRDLFWWGSRTPAALARLARQLT